ncbi:serine hydrolase [Patescibacteria group bacterium]|nr:serine hydrolase [Patescibacteria group bacterium]
MNIKNNWKLSAIVMFVVVSMLDVSVAQASVNGWMAEAMKMLEEQSLGNLSAEQVKEGSEEVAEIQSEPVALFVQDIEPVVSQFAEEDIVNEEFYINLNKETIDRGYTVRAFDGLMKISLVPGILSQETPVEIIKLNEGMDQPWSLSRVSPVYQFEFKNKSAYDSSNPFEIELSYDKEDGRYKEVFFFDKGYGTWRPLPTREYPNEKFVRAMIYLPYARVAVFSYPEVLTVGRASWYKYKNGDYVASPDFPKGSILKVTNLENNKSIDVTVNDWGPERDLFPDRVVDLDKVAFGKIASVGAGIIDVKVEPIFIAKSNESRFGLGKLGATINPAISSSAAIVYVEEDGEIVYDKNATSSLSIASLTKLIAISTFFNTRPSLNEVVVYLDQDEKNNHRYVDEIWRIAKLELKEGDKITLEDLLYASLVGSYNNTIETIVRASGLTRDEFVAKMNENVIEWGAKSTHFIEPTGLAPENVSTAEDYAIITKELFKNPLIKKTSTMSVYEFGLLNREEKFKVVNRNHLILKNIYRIIGSKTGYLDEAGYCLMTRVRTPDNKHMVIVLLGADSRDQTFIETEELIQYGLLKKRGD